MSYGHGPAPKSRRGAFSTLSWLAGTIRSSHKVVRSVSMSRIWVAGSATPRPERTARMDRTVRRMVMVEVLNGWVERVGCG